MKSVILFLIIILFVSAYLFLTKIDNTTEDLKLLGVKLNEAKIIVELADTPEKRTLGLSGRESLGKNEGMLFVFDEPSIRNFWMKNMKFALDIIWIDENKKIVDITKNALPESYPEKFSSLSPVKYVLEISAGFTDKYNIKIGDKADFELGSF